MIMSAVAYLRPLPDATQSKLQKKYMPKKVRYSLVTSSVASLQRVNVVDRHSLVTSSASLQRVKCGRQTLTSH